MFGWLRNTKKKTTKIYITIYKENNEWNVYISEKRKQKSSQYDNLKTEDIKITLHKEKSNEYAFVSMNGYGTNAIVKASRLHTDTKVLSQVLYGFDENKKEILMYDEDNQLFYINPNGIETNPIFIKSTTETRCFQFNYSEGKYTIQTNGQIVMQMKSSSSVSFFKADKIQGWITEDYKKYMPYLCSVSGIWHIL